MCKLSINESISGIEIIMENGEIGRKASAADSSKYYKEIFKSDDEIV